jgi:hypothetical protein
MPRALAIDQELTFWFSVWIFVRREKVAFLSRKQLYTISINARWWMTLLTGICGSREDLDRFETRGRMRRHPKQNKLLFSAGTI